MGGLEIIKEEKKELDQNFENLHELQHTQIVKSWTMSLTSETD